MSKRRYSKAWACVALVAAAVGVPAGASALIMANVSRNPAIAPPSAGPAVDFGSGTNRVRWSGDVDFFSTRTRLRTLGPSLTQPGTNGQYNWGVASFCINGQTISGQSSPASAVPTTGIKDFTAPCSGFGNAVNFGQVGVDSLPAG